MDGRYSHFKAKFCKTRSNQFCKKLKDLAVFFESNDFTPTESKKIFHVVAQDGYLLQAIKVYRALCGCQEETLYAHPEDDKDVLKFVVETFSHQPYVYLVMVRSKPVEQSESALEEIGNRLRKVLELYDEKKVILIASQDDGLVRQLHSNDDVFHIMNGSVRFEDFAKECRERLQTSKSILFQGEKMSLVELFELEADEGYEAALHGDLLERLVRGEAIKVGSESLRPEDPPENCYVGRVLRRNGQEVTDVDLLRTRDKMVLIAGGVGSGKSTLLAKLAETIKSESPCCWLVSVRLQDCIAALKECQRRGRDAILLEELLDTMEVTKLATPFEKILFRRRESVILILDGIDEAFPDYERLVLGLLAECRDAPNVLKVILTSRQHALEQLKDMLGVAAFTLQPFTPDDLKKFLVAHWMHCLGIPEVSKKKCETYATELMVQVFPSGINNHFVGTPLGAKVLAQLFERSDSKDESTEWEGCREYLNADRAKPKLSKRLIPTLFEEFIKEMRTVFMNRVDPSGSTLLNSLYEECLACHQILAVDEIQMNEKERKLFLGNRQIDKNLEMALLRMGFVQKLNDKLCFAYRGFKEYFLAKIILKGLQSANQNTELQEYVVQTAFSSDNFKDIRAFLNKSLKGVVELLPSGLFQIDRLPSNLIHQLAEEGCETILELVFKCINCQINVNNKYTAARRTALHEAAENGHLPTVKFLVERGADVNMKEKDGWTALHYAAWDGHLATVEFLVERGADVDMKDSKGTTALQHATIGRHLDIIKFLSDYISSKNDKRKS